MTKKYMDYHINKEYAMWFSLTFIINSLAPGKFEWNFRYVIFQGILVIDAWGISCEIALIWMSVDFTDDKSRLVLVMAWCRRATSHYLSQCWPRSLTPYGITRPQWVKLLSSGGCGFDFIWAIFKCTVSWAFPVLLPLGEVSIGSLIYVVIRHL